MSSLTKTTIFSLLLRLSLAGTPESCPANAADLSCSGSSTNTCCINSPGGLFQQVQFWDTDPATGPSDSWTIHGLWPNNCDGTYSESCDSSRAYTDITTLLKNAGETSTLSYMQTYWLSDDESDEKFWEHEWSTHGTCISTLEPSCYTDYTTGEEAVDFFVKVVELFQGLPTYTWLANAGITPSDDTTYALSAMESALESAFGAPVILLCQDTNVVYEIYYGYNTDGNLQNGTFIPTSNVGTSTNCPKTVKYPTK
ncbi:putative ribonuclease T2 [Mollisia scopiformis]|uniref:ribonuclease T2 n=1 Tax=Mollisia scopiformis TaxID=149040 RepID=A0A194X7Q7_MOLSC|nr:putative ribonuclease T2 [Mollisia scopiformis]KUJ15842.1 putative ribonuclease T2 [Mollisia scopiformis]